MNKTKMSVGSKRQKKNENKEEEVGTEPREV